MEITLNLASTEIRNRRRLHALAVAGLCLSVVLGLGNVLLYRSSRAALRMAEERLQQFEQTMQQQEQRLAGLPHRLSPKELEQFGARINFYNRIILGANFSFSRLLFELEQAIPPGVTLTEIEPDLGKAGVILSGTATGMEDILRCIERLKAREGFHRVYLLNHAAEKGSNRLRFTISLGYRGEMA